MKKIYMMLLAAIIVMPVFAADKLRVAVFNPTSSGTAIDEGTRVAIREIISSTLVNSGNYDIVERSLLEKVMQEQQFSNSGVVNDNDATEIGKLAGANKIVLSVVTLTERRYMISVKMIDVKTANIEKQKVKIIEAGRLLDNIEPITLSLLGAEDEYRNLNPESEVRTTAYTPVPVSNNTPNNGTKVSAKKRTKAKYSCIVDLGASFLNISSKDVPTPRGSSIEVSTTHGCQITPYLFVGAGLGFRYLYDHDDDYYGYYYYYHDYYYYDDYDDYDDDYDCSLPIYANVRGCIPTKKITPFAEVRVGYDVLLGGLYLAPAVGITVRKFDFSIGYTMQSWDYYCDSDDGHGDLYSDSVNVGSLTIRLGLKF